MLKRFDEIIDREVNTTEYDKKTDGELVSLTISGDSDAFNTLVVRHKNLVWRAVTNIVSDYHTAEDIAQETFIDAYTSLTKLIERDKFAPWVYGIAKRKALHCVSRRKISDDIDDYIEFLVSDSPTPEEKLLEVEKKQAVRRAIAGLSKKNRETVELFYLGNLSISQISEKTGVSPAAVKSRLYEAREKLKGELSYMKEERKIQKMEKIPNIEKAVSEKIAKLKAYKLIYGSDSRYDEMYAETEKMLLDITDSFDKKEFLQSFYNEIYNEKLETADGINKISENIGKGAAKAQEAYSKLWENQDDEVWRKILGEALSDDDVKSSPASASLYFWRGKTFLERNDYNSAKDDFEAAVKVGKKDNIWRSLAKVAIRSMDISDKYTEKSMSSLNMTAEGYVKDKNALLFFEQPGWSMSNSWYYSHKNSFSSIFYYISRSRRTFFNTDMKIGEKITDKAGGELTLESYSDEITTSLGSFTCMKLIYKENEYTAEAWYAKNIGLVKADFTPIHGKKEIYELSEYEIKGGDGYYPMAEGNRWRYTNSLMPEYIYYFNEYEIDWTDGISCHVMNPGVVGLKKDCDMLSTVGGEYYIRKCDKLCDEWKTEEAIEELKKAVRVNTSEIDTISALGGIEYLNEFLAAQRKNYRFCPSSFNLFEMTVKDSKPQYTENIVSFGPYRFGTRFEENRIFGVKPLRYLEQVAGCLWDDRWEVGFSEERDINVFDMPGRLSLTVEDGGTVTTPAGTFTNTLKLTLNAKSTEREGDYYFGDNYIYVWAGVKEYWFARGVGIVKHVCTWENTLSSVCSLTSYSCPAADDSYMPIQIGNRWEYDEENLTREGYRAKMFMAIKSGMADRYLMTHSQQFWYLGTEEEYEEFKKNLN